VLNMFNMFTIFIGLMMAIIVLFTVVNTVTMSVLERTSELGTIRALGVRRQGIRLQFLVEGCILGMIGATAGVILALAVEWLVNDAGLTWRPPATSAPVPFKLVLYGNWELILMAWVALVLVAIAATILPANRAARLSVVDALRYV
jgi:putative ABC transport system permease protein